MKIHKFTIKGGPISIYITEESLIISTIKDAITFIMICGMGYINYTYIGNSWMISTFMLISILGFFMKYSSTVISKKQLMEYLK